MGSLFAASLVALAAAGSAPAHSGPVKTAARACLLVKARYHASTGFPLRRIGFCDTVARSDSPPGFYVLGLHSTRRCPYICSSLLGWFAVRKADGRVFQWDVPSDRLGPPFEHRRVRRSR